MTSTFALLIVHVSLPQFRIGIIKHSNNLWSYRTGEYRLISMLGPWMPFASAIFILNSRIVLSALSLFVSKYLKLLISCKMEFVSLILNGVSCFSEITILIVFLKFWAYFFTLYWWCLLCLATLFLMLLRVQHLTCTWSIGTGHFVLQWLSQQVFLVC